ncbi:signal recognition particle 9 kDa protein-domain-containing protein [Penicillium waksmanii]|uniref:signal recognition particle 9 kDa protein-domain-containing protein n=1 Tax=Penicillium waksmanii TaxID=69791 RepID=UPI0025496212|nr:signal recognition particle 9 kDa protein-domain-containing protein [Penicillium waksmanii]KAJ5973454.1 signal recognition particle 9 kDa protein-domain-containing protein [Penicillium waksmanii]
MTYLETSQAYLEQSAQLLEAYPETNAPHKSSNAQNHKPNPTSPPQPPQNPPAAPIASLTLKTYNPESGITIQYRTNKLQEVGRLMTGLGKLAAGADVASLGLSAPAGADIEMTDAPEEGASSAPVPAATKGQAQGGKGKKKKGGKK